MRNLNESTWYCYTCEREVEDGHNRYHNVQLLPLVRIPWNQRGEWLAENATGFPSSVVFFDEE